MRRFGNEDYFAAGLIALVVVLLGFAVYSRLPGEQLKADDLVARYTLYLVFATFFLAAVSGAQFYFLKRADETTRITAQAALDANRPWLAIQGAIADGPLQLIENDPFDGVYLMLGLRCKLHNVGKSPAVRTNVRVKARTFSTRGVLPPTSSIFNLAVFPDEYVTTDKCLTRLARNDVKPLFTEGDHFSLIAVVEVEYEFNGGKGTTSKSFQLMTTGSLNLRNLPLQKRDLYFQELKYLDNAT